MLAMKALRPAFTPATRLPRKPIGSAMIFSIAAAALARIPSSRLAVPIPAGPEQVGDGGLVIFAEDQVGVPRVASGPVPDGRDQLCGRQRWLGGGALSHRRGV
jgi:hypothetical protein